MEDDHEAHGMAKKQTTIQLPEDVYRLAHGVEARTGARFNRQVLAALLQYYFTEPGGPNPLWMEWAVAIERGEIGIGDMPAERAQLVSAEAPSATGDAAITPGGEVKEVPAGFRQRANAWRKMMRGQGDDLIAGILAHWARAERRS